jgi:hypothetical protein
MSIPMVKIRYRMDEAFLWTWLPMDDKGAQKQAEELVNPDDKPNVERVLNTKGGGRDQWRSE